MQLLIDVLQLVVLIALWKAHGTAVHEWNLDRRFLVEQMILTRKCPRCRKLNQRESDQC